MFTRGRAVHPPELSTKSVLTRRRAARTRCGELRATEVAALADHLAAQLAAVTRTPSLLRSPIAELPPMTPSRRCRCRRSRAVDRQPEMARMISCGAARGASMPSRARAWATANLLRVTREDAAALEISLAS